MGKTVAAALILILVVLVIWTGVAVAVKAIQAARWQRALRQAKWVPHVEITGPREVTVSVRRVASLGRRREVLSEFAPEVIQITGLGDPRLTEAMTVAGEQAILNNAVNLRED